MACGAADSSWTVWEDKLRSFNGTLCQSSSVRWAADKVGVQPWVVVSAGCCWTLCFLLWGFTGELVCTAAGLLYPMYASFKALEGGQQDDVLQWLRYWTTYAALSLTETVFYKALAWVPFYHILRILIVLWLFHPSTGGAESVYHWVVGPLLRRYSPKIDTALARSAEDVRDTFSAAAGCHNGIEIRSALYKAAAVGAGYVAHDLGMEDLMMRELANTTSAHISQVAMDKMSRPDGGARARVASPAPRMPPALQHPVITGGPLPPPPPRENKENAYS